jgi:hypothetical protein
MPTLAMPLLCSSNPSIGDTLKPWVNPSSKGNSMIVTEEAAGSFAQAWIDAWNSHDLNRILEHYAANVVFHSPFIVKVLDDNTGRIIGKPALSAYFTRALAAYPDLHFQLHTVLSGIDGITLYYTSVKGLLAAETMLLDAAGNIATVHAHYNHV